MADQGMNEQGKVETLDKLIGNERGAIKWSLISAIGLFAIGVIISIIVYRLSDRSSDSLSNAIKAIPALFTAFLAGFPIKEYFAKKNRITSCEFLRIAYKSPPVPQETDKRFWTLVDKSLG